MYTLYVNVLTYLLVNFRSSQNLAGELTQPQPTRQDGPVRVVPGVKASPCTVTERRIPEMIPVLGSQPVGEVSHKPSSSCQYFPPGLQLPPQPLRGLLPILLLGVNSLPKTVTRQRRDCDLNPGPSAPESSTLTTRLPSK